MVTLGPSATSEMKEENIQTKKLPVAPVVQLVTSKPSDVGT